MAMQQILVLYSDIDTVVEDTNEFYGKLQGRLLNGD